MSLSFSLPPPATEAGNVFESRRALVYSLYLRHTGGKAVHAAALPPEVRVYLFVRGIPSLGVLLHSFLPPSTYSSSVWTVALFLPLARLNVQSVGCNMCAANGDRERKRELDPVSLQRVFDSHSRTHSLSLSLSLVNFVCPSLHQQPSMAPTQQSPPKTEEFIDTQPRGFRQLRNGLARHVVIHVLYVPFVCLVTLGREELLLLLKIVPFNVATAQCTAPSIQPPALVLYNALGSRNAV
mgnify:FL=1